MADKVHITKHGIQALKWDGDVRQYIRQEIQSGLQVLRCACHIDADVTLGDIFRAVEPDADLVGFLEQWSSCDLEGFHSAASKPATEASDSPYIEISKHFEWDQHEA